MFTNGLSMRRAFSEKRVNTPHVIQHDEDAPYERHNKMRRNSVSHSPLEDSVVSCQPILTTLPKAMPTIVMRSISNGGGGGGGGLRSPLSTSGHKRRTYHKVNRRSFSEGHRPSSLAFALPASPILSPTQQQLSRSDSSTSIGVEKLEEEMNSVNHFDIQRKHDYMETVYTKPCVCVLCSIGYYYF
jgi:hypothetical protein